MKILIVDDPAGMRETLGALLSCREYAVETCSLGDETLETCRRFASARVLMDVALKNAALDGADDPAPIILPGFPNPSYGSGSEKLRQGPGTVTPFDPFGELRAGKMARPGSPDLLKSCAAPPAVLASRAFLDMGGGSD